MNKNRWYLSTWFIGILFACWFLLIPLIIGIYLIPMQSRVRLAKQQEDEMEFKHTMLEELERTHQRLLNQTKDKENEFCLWETRLKTKEDDLETRFTELQEKVIEVERVHQESLIIKFRTKEEDLSLREVALQARESDFEHKLAEKQKVLGILKLSHKLRLIQQAKEREQLDELWKSQVEKRERELDLRLLKKQQDIDEFEREHRQRIIQRTKEREHANFLWNLKVESREKKFEVRKVEIEKEIHELNRLRQEQLSSQEKTWADELKSRESAIESKRLEYELKLKELENIEKAHKQKLNDMTKAREDELIARGNLLSILEESLTKREKDAKSLEQEIHRSEQIIAMLKSQIIILDDELLYQSFGFYETRYDLENSEEYKNYLEKVKNEQKKLVEEKRAVITNVYSDEVDDSIIDNHVKLAIRSFNNDCDSVISKVKFSNVEVSEKKIRTSFHYINELNRHNYIELAEKFLSLKLEELFLAYEYYQRKQEEREEQRRINEQIREERKAQQELEEQLKILRKEEKHLENALKHSAQFTEDRTNEIKARLEEIQRQKEDVDYRFKNMKAGYVYVISNIGSFGENVYKIGMTRRLDPLERVRELGGASVPFRYDVHAVIFSDNAPELEASLHRTFTHHRVNKINERKEFFRVSLKDIKEAVFQNHNAIIEFTMAAEAQEYRETRLLEKQIDQLIPSYNYGDK